MRGVKAVVQKGKRRKTDYDAEGRVAYRVRAQCSAAWRRVRSPRRLQVMVHVIEARELKARDKNAMSDPYVKVTVFGETQKTSKKKKTLNCTCRCCSEGLALQWQCGVLMSTRRLAGDQMLNYTARVTDKDFKRQNVLFEVMDANTIRRNRIIGKYALDLAYVYEQEDHEVRSWIAVADLSKFEGVQGYLKVRVRASVCVGRSVFY